MALTLGTKRGYSLIELLVTLMVAAILAAVAAPNFGEMYRQQQLNDHMTELVNAHRLARSESANRGRTVTVCKSADATTSTPTCGDDTVEWEDGWIVFQNTDNDSPAVIDSGEPVVRVAAALKSSLTLRGTSTVDPHVSYLATGEVATPGMLVLCDNASLSYSRALFISITGRIKVANRDVNGTPLDNDGSPIDSCEPS